jgi:integrase/recombinase XerD
MPHQRRSDVGRSKPAIRADASPDSGKPPLLEDAIRDFLIYIRVQRGLTQSTQKTYRCRLNAFLRWLKAHGHLIARVVSLNPTALTGYLHSLTQEHKRPRTIRANFAPIRSLANFLVETGILDTNPMDRVKLPQRDAAERKQVSDEEVEALIAACERLPPKEVVLARAVLYVLIFAGLRRQELIDLKVGDVNDRERSILVRSGKGSKSRRIYVCGECIDALVQWLTIRPQVALEDLWAYGHVRSMHESKLKRILEHIKTAAGFQSRTHITPHALRHACASRMLKNGADIGAISAFLGHSSLLTTQIYLHVNEERLRDVADLTALTPPTPSRQGTRPRSSSQIARPSQVSSSLADDLLRRRHRHPSKKER